MSEANTERRDATQPAEPHNASGGPGEKPLWSSGAKTAVGTAVRRSSRVWFTLGQGVLNEIYYPDIDIANTRIARFVVTDGKEFFSDEEQDAVHVASALAPGVPAYKIVSTCRLGRYRITKEFLADPGRASVLMNCRFEALQQADLHLYFSVEPHMADQGAENNGWTGLYQGIEMMFAARDNAALAIFASVPFLATTCGFIGKNDGYTQLKEAFALKKIYNRAANGNIGLCAELDWKSAGGDFMIALSFGLFPAEAAQQARAGILAGFAQPKKTYIDQWQTVQSRYLDLKVPEGSSHDLYRVSTAVLQSHESKHFPGGFIASLSLPWGFAKGDKDIAGYHVVWPRDLCESAKGLMASGDYEAGRRALFYLTCVQKSDGSWSQNMWLDGTEHWTAVQMDGIGMPILLADQLRRAGELESDPWPMIQKAAAFLVRMGPVTGQDRWEALPGYATFTMACEIAALLAAADFAQAAGKTAEADFLRLTADAWNDAVDTLTYATGTKLAKEVGVEGYYLRLTPPDAIKEPKLESLTFTLANHPLLMGRRHAVEVVSPDALALVRFGLRAFDDARIQATVKVIDATLRREMTTGSGWIRSTDDGYGEHADGSPFDGTGIGHCWPLLAGERGHFALAGGDRETANEMLRTISRQTSACGMIPEQVWSADDIAKHDLYNGHPAGSGMPLAWAHAEYVKLLRSLADGKVWDMSPQTVQRYQVEKVQCAFEIWTEEAAREWVTLGKQLRMDFNAAASVSWRVDEGAEQILETDAPVLGLHSVLLPLEGVWKELVCDVAQGEKTRRLKLRVRK